MIQANKLSELYRDQVIGVEGELSRLREEDSLNRTMYKERYDDNNDSRSKIAKRRKWVVMAVPLSIEATTTLAD